MNRTILEIRGHREINPRNEFLLVFITIYNKVAIIMMKKRIHLTESQFHDIIMEVVQKRDRAKMLARRKMDVIAKTRQMEKFADKITEDVIRKIKDTSFPRFNHNPAVSHSPKRPLKLL